MSKAGLAGLGPNVFNQSSPGRVERFLNSLAIRAGSSILLGSGANSIKGSIKNSNCFKISYIIINKSHIFYNVHNLSLVFNDFSRFKIFLKHLCFFSFSQIFNKISLTILIIFFFAKIFKFIFTFI